jgi:hypothetical protein
MPSGMSNRYFARVSWKQLTLPTESMLARSLRDNGEMYNQIKAVEEGWNATVADALDYHVVCDARMAIKRNFG